MVKNYLCIESQGADTRHFLALARDLKQQGNSVEVLLVQNGVLAARADAASDCLGETLRSGIQVWADDFSMRERALAAANLKRGVHPAAIATVIERMAAGWNVLWH
jgi:intracellular sulfur oxidation DsrE/DsrF family protein